MHDALIAYLWVASIGLAVPVGVQLERYTLTMWLTVFLGPLGLLIATQLPKPRPPGTTSN